MYANVSSIHQRGMVYEFCNELRPKNINYSLNFSQKHRFNVLKFIYNKVLFFSLKSSCLHSTNHNLNEKYTRVKKVECILFNYVIHLE